MAFKIIHVLFTVFLIVAIFALCVESEKRGRKRQKPGVQDRQKQQLKKHKKMMIQCCGRKSCINVVLKKKPNSTLVTQVKRQDPTKKLTKRPVNKRTFADNREHEDNKEISDGSEFPSSLGVASDEKQTTNNVDSSKSSAEQSTESLISAETSLKSEVNPEEKISDVVFTTFPSTVESKRSPETPLPDSVNAKTIESSTSIESSLALSTVSQKSSSSGISSSLSSAVSTSSKDSTQSTSSASIHLSSSSTKSSETMSLSEFSTTSTKSAESITSTMSPSTSFASTTSSKPTTTTTTSTTSTTTQRKTTTTPTTITIPMNLNITKPTPATTKPPLVFPSCPTKCNKDQSFFKTDGSLEDPDFHGFWTSACGELFVFGKVLVNWEQNVEACCKLGMNPISFESESKTRCFNTFINGKNWKYNSRYWTNGLRMNETSFKWCSNRMAVNNFNNSLWMQGQPNNENQTENCAQMVVFKENSTVMIEDRKCSVVSALACQGPPTQPPPCVSPTCPNITCAKNMAFYKTLNDGKTSHLIDPKSHGTWVDVEDKTYLFSFPNDTRNYLNAMLACCSVGMKLLSLHLPFLYKTIPAAMKKGNVNTGSFWTSATDEGCEDSFGYCSTNRLLREEARWAPDQPDNLLNKEHCLVVDLKVGSALLSDVNCDNSYQYICVGRMKSGARVVENECAAAFNLTAAEVIAMMESFPTTLQEKCFLKCYGEGTDMFVNGKLVEEKIIAQFASVSSGDVDKLMDMYSTFNFCSNLTRGMDACDKASRLLKCGKDNSPDAVAGLMKILENTITEAPVVMPPQQAVCPTDYKCIVDESLKLLYDNAASGTVIDTPKFSGAVKHACNKKFLMLILNGAATVTFAQSLEMCCSFGMKLVTIETKTKMDCMATADLHFNLPTYSFAVAATKLGFLSKPIWCFTNQLFDGTWFNPNYVSSITDPTRFNIVVKFRSPPEAYLTYGAEHNTVACESL